MISAGMPKPVMISFSRSVGELRLMGLVAWGGLCLDLTGLRARDVAVRLGAPRLWLETLLEAVAQSGTRRLVLVDPDFSVFMGEAGESSRRLEDWARRRGVVVTRMLTRAVARQAA
jgi:hypothetical protein